MIQCAFDGANLRPRAPEFLGSAQTSGDHRLKQDVEAAPMDRRVEVLLGLRHGMDPF